MLTVTNISSKIILPHPWKVMQRNLLSWLRNKNARTIGEAMKLMPWNCLCFSIITLGCKEMNDLSIPIVNHIYLQNGTGTSYYGEIYLDSLLVFTDTIKSVDYMPPIFKTIVVADLSKYKKITVLLENEKYEKEIPGKTVDILVNLDNRQELLEYLIQFYSSAVKLK